MDNYKPTDKDFLFVSNGYQCGVGVYFPFGDDERTQFHLQMTKQKVAGGSVNQYEDWEPVYEMFYIDPDKFESPQALMSEFLVKANPKLADMTGGEAPPIPATFLEQLEHLCRYGLAFNASTGQVYIK